MTAALPTRDAIVATAQESIARGSKSFAAASKLFNRPTRERAWLLYAWCRACDDIADGQDHGHGMSVVADAPERLVRVRAMTEAALAGEWVGDPAFDALRIVAAETCLPHGFARDLIEGFALDARDWRPRSEADLYKYCYHVAGVVGCMMAVIMGVSPDDEATLDRACDLGMAFQLANIARDIEEDDRVGRCYVPEEWLVEMDMPPGQHMKPPFRSRLAILTQRLADRAAAFEASARIGTTRLDLRSAWAVLAAAGIYGAIGRAVAARGEHAWDHRVTTSTSAKIGFISRALGEALRRRALYPPVPRDPALWTRPRR
ncbi:phytoene/squalene synthase family protein [Sphingomonas sp. So64.6b]|uniref:phytoene/squalene synthase family protein n=1 Tax=Sphingomonas sp. So64.6b TaxID=2997354 RepID=UPI001603A3FD|nr:phytoene/squalene synthase family protein [Sphingomonas sp. So64.6b]QNA85920.1 phytoene/squalene synthase family protein [Sphingomonas sp. So64.6b]